MSIRASSKTGSTLFLVRIFLSRSHYDQGTLAKVEGSVQLTSTLRQLVLKTKTNMCLRIEQHLLDTNAGKQLS